MGIMPSTQDETALAVDRVRYVGEPVAAVAALDEDTAFDALSLIQVDYEDLEPIFTIEEALEREDVKIHDESQARQRVQRGPSLLRRSRGWVRIGRPRARRLVLFSRATHTPHRVAQRGRFVRTG